MKYYIDEKGNITIQGEKKTLMKGHTKYHPEITLTDEEFSIIDQERTGKVIGKTVSGKWERGEEEKCCENKDSSEFFSEAEEANDKYINNHF